MSRMRIEVGAAIVLALGLGLLGGWSLSGAMSETMAFPASSDGGHQHGGVQLGPDGERVASGLSCPCGCPDLLLACGCTNRGGATEVKMKIVELLRSGLSESQARIELINRYGSAIQRQAR